MRGGSGKRLAWRVRWYVTADGVLLEQRSRGEADHEQLYRHYPATRPLSGPDGTALHDRLVQAKRITDRGAAPLTLLALVLLLVSVAAVVALLLGVGAAVRVLVVSGPGFVLALVAGQVLSGMFHRRFLAAWEEAGVTNPDGITMGAHQAREAIADPGTVIARDTREKRA